MLENPGPQSTEFDATLLRASVLQRGRAREMQFLGGEGLQVAAAAAAPAKSLQSCPTLCNPRRRQTTRLPRPWDSPGKNTGVGCHFLLHAWKWKVKVKSFSHVQLSVTPWTAPHQAPPSMGFSRQEYWSGVPLPSPGDLPDPGTEPRSPALAGRFFTTEPHGKPPIVLY